MRLYQLFLKELLYPRRMVDTVLREHNSAADAFARFGFSLDLDCILL